ncbi:MAG TPA: hypothetical protein VF527_18295 [Pyrinomonadaceae bacterium]|jgi:hypothetical protein
MSKKKTSRKSSKKSVQEILTNNLTQEQIEEIRRSWKDISEAEWEMVHRVPWEIKKSLDNQVVAQMAHEGKALHDFGRNLYGAEAARRYKDRVLSWIVGELDQYHDQIHSIVCTKSDYCNKRKQKKFEEEGYVIAIAVADALMTVVTGLPVPITLISVYIVKRGILDKWCKCSESLPAKQA